MKPPYRVPLMSEISQLPWNGLNTVSTFSGCGGSCLGFKMAGYRVLWANEFVPAAQDTYRANHHGTHLSTADISTVTGAQIRDVIGGIDLDVFEGSPPCFGAGTPVLTRRGVVPIEQVIVGDEVLTHTLSWQRVSRTMTRQAETLLLDNRLVVTTDHLFLTRQKTKGSGPIYLDKEAWRPASAIEKLFVGTPISFPTETAYPDAPDGFEYSYDFWYIVGRWLGDGWIRLQDGDADIIRAADRKALNTASVPCLMCGQPSVPHSRASHAKYFSSYCSKRCRKTFERQRHKRPRATTLICSSHKEAEDLYDRLARLDLAVGVQNQRATVRFTLSRRSLTEWLLRWFNSGAKNKTMPGWMFGIETEWRSEEHT